MWVIGLLGKRSCKNACFYLKYPVTKMTSLEWNNQFKDLSLSHHFRPNSLSRNLLPLSLALSSLLSQLSLKKPSPSLSLASHLPPFIYLKHATVSPSPRCWFRLWHWKIHSIFRIPDYRYKCKTSFSIVDMRFFGFFYFLFFWVKPSFGFRVVEILRVSFFSSPTILLAVKIEWI